jgi:hypothetical protein
MPDAVGTTHEIQLDGKFFRVRPGTYFKSSSPTPVGPQVAGKQVDLAPLKSWFQDTWVGGLGQDVWQDDAMYKDGFVDSYSHPHELRCLQLVEPLTNSAAWTDGVNSQPYFAIRSINATDKPRLYVAIANLAADASAGQVYRYREDLDTGQLKSLFAFAANRRPVAMNIVPKQGHPFFLGYSLAVMATGNGEMRFSDASGETLAGTIYKTWSNNQFATAIQHFNDADYYGLSRGSVSAALYRNPPSTIDKFYETGSMAIGGFTVWNGRLWFISQVSEGVSRLYVSDGTVVNMAYEWPTSFLASSIYAHWGYLYIGGTRQRYDESAGIGQLWRYNGATMDLIAQFDDSGLTSTPKFPASTNYVIPDMAGWGKFLVVPNTGRSMSDGTTRQGVWFYDPEEDAWHYGAYIPTADASGAQNRWVTQVIDFDGRLFMGCRNTGKVHFVRNDSSKFTQSQYVSSVFDGGLAQADKVFNKVVIKNEARKYSRITVEYSTDGGTVWTSLGNIDGPTSDTTVTQETTFTIGTAFIGVTARRLQLRLTMYPGDSAAVGYANATGNRTPKVFHHEVVWDYAPIVRHNWSMTVLALPYMVSPDGSRENKTGTTIMSDLWTIIENRKLVKFQDVDQKWWLVKVTGLNQYEAKIDYRDLEGRYAEMPISLQEFAELSSDGSTVVE